MCHPALRRLALRVGVLVALMYAASACGADEQQASKLRPLPEEGQELREGEYRSEEFDPRSPSGSAKAGRACHRRRPNTCTSNGKIREG